MKHMVSGLLAAGLLGATAGTAAAAGVTVQVEGKDKVLAPTAVTTPVNVTREGHTCPGDTAIGALDAGTAGSWTGNYQYWSVDSVLGEEHLFGSGAFWAVYLNGAYQNAGACDTKVKDGDEVLVYASDDPFVDGQGGYDEPVILTAPAKVAPGKAFTVTVKEATTTFDSNYTGTTSFPASAGATVTAGSVSATTGPDGTATLTVPGGGPLTIVATKGNRAPDRAASCATDGADGFCGTTAPTATTSGTAPTQSASVCRTTGDDGRCGSADKRAAYGFISAVSEGKRYKKGQGPRELAGRVDDEPSGIADVRLRLTRTDKRKCTTYDGKKESFVAMKRCGAARGVWFSAGTASDWRYLLPARLARGRYVLDVEVVDKRGNTDDELTRGRNRVVFFVG